MEKTDREAALRDETMPAKCKMSLSAGVMCEVVRRVRAFKASGMQRSTGRETLFTTWRPVGSETLD